MENSKSNKEKVTITLSVDRETREAAEQVCEELGLSLDVAINVFLKQVVIQKAIPFPITLQSHFFMNNNKF